MLGDMVCVIWTQIVSFTSDNSTTQLSKYRFLKKKMVWFGTRQYFVWRFVPKLHVAKLYLAVIIAMSSLRTRILYNPLQMVGRILCTIYFFDNAGCLLTWNLQQFTIINLICL